MPFNQPPAPGLIETSTLAIAGGAVCLSFLSASPIYGSLMIVAGSAGILFQALTFSKFDRIFKSLKLGVNDSYPIKKRVSHKDDYDLYEFTLPAGLSIEDFEKKHTAIEQYIGSRIEFSYGFKNLLIRIYTRELPKTWNYTPVDIKGRVGLLLGCDRQCNPVSIDLSDGEPHLLIAGETGSGKSTALRSIITNLIVASKVDLYLVDLKRGAEFNIFRKCLQVKEFARTEQEAEKLLEGVSNEVDRRYDLFYENDCIDIKHYKKKHPDDPMKYQVVVIDEFADLMYEKESISLLEGLAQKARACGIHLIISTQRPDARVLSSRIKANVPVVLGLKTMNDTNSRIIIGAAGLEKLRGSGHGILLHEGKTTELQCPLLSADDAISILKPFYRIETPKKRKSMFSGIGGVLFDDSKR
ncbi:MAG: FtsK/SpoIIIE domain-containing protein [Oscillibacter ruminantium]|uniref:FtsK/SpoIIIE domain-containing protein n=1 Tax=Oscillibacter ruminantium TaxID=1263547 RepID=UPI002B2172EA|nr:FtsK/SpoIIIE domain-containing protein [Oscillibacter ruminantium]MEA5042229.1 FtsK/SpoIIIE domain-containing protein [Oscillibacter ruminantium]